VGGWSLKEAENSNFRQNIIRSLDCDIFSVNETFFRNNETVSIDGYKFYSRNRKNVHKNAKRGSGGVGVFVKAELTQLYDISVLDDVKEDILWLKFATDSYSENIILCVCYLPPSESTRLNDPELFYSTLLEQVYTYQNEGRMFICGDFNSRVGDASEYIEGVDDVILRDVIDFSSNANGDLFIEFLVDCGMCMVNGRVGQNDFTHVSHRGKSVVDYVCTPYEQLSSVSDFHVYLMSDLVNALNCHGVTKVPDHSVLTWTVNGCAKKTPVQETTTAQTYTKYNAANIPVSFLNDDISLEQVVTAINRIECELEQLSDANMAYASFKELIFSEMDRKLPKRIVNPRCRRTAKSLYKPYWSEELDLKWEAVRTCERNWLRSSGGVAEKRRLRTLYVNERRHFEKLLKKAKRSYQLGEQQRLLDIHTGHNTRDFWREIGKLGIQNERKTGIPMEVIDSSGNVSADCDTVINRWKSDYEELFSESNDPRFDDNHLQDIKRKLSHNTVPCLDTDISMLNEPISREEVERSICRAKLKRAAGFDGIPAEVLRNPVCIDLLHKIINFCFENGTVPSEWNTGVIKPIPKSDSKDPRNPLSYRGICLISIPCKIYADILNLRFSEWIDQNNIVVDEQNGFRRNRSCLEHIYSLYSVINKRKQQRQSTYVCFVDAKKAFDTVQRDCLWYKLISLGI
ncbi:MAG: reverse transcriptase family protein, partial [Candidatus Thiodiazotropha sp.]